MVMKDELSEDQELKEFDQWMKTLPIQKVGENFTATVIASAVLMQKRNRSMKLLIWIIILLFGVIILSFFLEPVGLVDLPPLDIPKLDFNGYPSLTERVTSIFTNSSIIMFCIVLEAILCLLIIDQVVNYYRYIKRNVIKLRL